MTDSEKSSRNEGFSKRSFLRKVHKSLAILVSFGPFCKTGIPTQKRVVSTHREAYTGWCTSHTSGRRHIQGGVPLIPQGVGREACLVGIPQGV